MLLLYSGATSSHAGTGQRSNTSTGRCRPVRAGEPLMREMLHGPGDRAMIPERTRRGPEHGRGRGQTMTFTPAINRHRISPQNIRHARRLQHGRDNPRGEPLTRVEPLPTTAHASSSVSIRIPSAFKPAGVRPS